MNPILAQMATPEIRAVWSSANRTAIERRIWLVVLAYHVEVGIADAAALEAYRAAVYADTQQRAIEIERIRRHDVKARIEAWNEVVGYEQIHLGMTSADIVDNAAQIQIRQSCLVLCREGQFPLMVGALSRQRIRGIWGAVGTGMDQIALTGDRDAPAILSSRLASEFGFAEPMDSVGQQYPRGTDLDVATAVLDGIRSSPFGPRLGLDAIGAGLMAMLVSISGDQWYEGDVSSSAVRRVAWPNLMAAGSAAWQHEPARA